MTKKILKKISGAVGVIAVAIMTLYIPSVTHGYEAPRCVLNAIVQPTNNGGTTLSWRVYNSNSATLTMVGSVADTGVVVVYPTEQTTYTLKAYGYGGVDTCTVIAQPVSSYSFHNGVIGTQNTNQECSMWVNPDEVVAGGTGILSWNAGSARKAWIDHGIGNVSNRDSRIIKNIGIPQTFKMTATYGDATERTCEATLYPVGTLPNKGDNSTVNGKGTFTPNVQYVAINQVPYTGTDDGVYFLVLLAISLGAFGVVYAKRDAFLESLKRNAIR